MPAEELDDVPLPLGEDPALMVQVLARRLADRILEDGAAAGFGDVRESDGYVFQHLLPGALAVGELADRLGITQQGTSKAVADLERRGLVRRIADPADARVRRVALTDRAFGAVAEARRTRRRFADEVAELLGDRSAASLRRSLARVVDDVGGAADVERRRVRGPR